MGKIPRINWVPWLIFSIIIIGFDQWDYYTTQHRINSTPNIPIPAPDTTLGEPLFYSTQIHAWVYATTPRAKAVKVEKEPYEDLDKYLKKKIPIYRKKTYWGEEWDEEDEEDEVDDDMNQEEGH